MKEDFLYTKEGQEGQTFDEEVIGKISEAVESVIGTSKIVGEKWEYKEGYVSYTIDVSSPIKTIDMKVSDWRPTEYLMDFTCPYCGGARRIYEQEIGPEVVEVSCLDCRRKYRVNIKEG